MPDIKSVPTAARNTAEVTGATNWQRLQAAIASHKPQIPSDPKRYYRGRKRQKVLEGSGEIARVAPVVDGVIDGHLVAKGSRMEPTAAVALDCEMVGVGLDGLRNALAKVCVVCTAVWFLAIPWILELMAAMVADGMITDPQVIWCCLPRRRRWTARWLRLAGVGCAMPLRKPARCV